MERQLAWLGVVRNFSLNGGFCGRKSLNSFVTVRKRGQNIQKNPFLLPANEYGVFSLRILDNRKQKTTLFWVVNIKVSAGREKMAKWGDICLHGQVFHS